MPYTEDCSPARSQRKPNKELSAGCGIPHLKLLIRDILETPPPKKNNYSLLLFLLFAHQNLMVISYCWRDHRTWRNQVSTGQGLSPYWLTFTVLEDATQAPGLGWHHQYHPSVNPVNYNNDQYGKNTTMGTIMAQMWVTNGLLVGFKACSILTTVNLVSIP